MVTLISLLYILFLIVYVIIAVFVLYHLKTYTVNHTLAAFFSIFFVVVTSLLIFINVSLFLAVPFAQLLPSSFGFTSF